ncbi:hypothetical protein [Streptomyces sp. NRRL B-24572]|nr:hypothetical protein [Streptomyces sp. NRRL B-24572]
MPRYSRRGKTEATSRLTDTEFETFMKAARAEARRHRLGRPPMDGTDSR